MPMYGIPETCTEILKNFNFSDFNRTARQKGLYHFVHKLYPELRVVYNTKLKLILFKRTIKGAFGTRQDSITYQFVKNKVTKFYMEKPSHINKVISEYDFSTDNDEIFMQSTIQDKFYPTYDDFIKMKRLECAFRQDVYIWDKVLTERAKQRRIESLEKYKPFMFKGKKKC